jgi:hypothetical protein
MSRTPRTLAECRFTTGYSIARPSASARGADGMRIALCIVACIVIGLLIGRASA